MKKNIDILKKTQLFSGVSDEEISAMLDCLQAKIINYQKSEYVFREGEHINQICVLLEGKLLVQRDDFWGNRSIVNIISMGEMFGEAYAAPDSGAILNVVIAQENCSIIFFDVQKLLTVCPTACKFHSMIIQNLFYAISDKNRKLVQKIGHMSMRSTRSKLISYLSDEAKRQNRSYFTIPFNRQQLADFLSVDRSAMSNELSKMRDEGLISFERNNFKLLL